MMTMMIGIIFISYPKLKKVVTKNYHFWSKFVKSRQQKQLWQPNIFWNGLLFEVNLYDFDSSQAHYLYGRFPNNCCPLFSTSPEIIEVKVCNRQADKLRDSHKSLSQCIGGWQFFLMVKFSNSTRFAGKG